MNKKSNIDKHRIILIDVIKIFCAILIYARHSITMYGCTYGSLLNGIIVNLTAPVMTCFFVVSGFCIHYQNIGKELNSHWIQGFIKKRLITLMPSYLLVVIIWPFVYRDQIRDWAILLPVDLFGMQTMYSTLFGIIHNGGTWFVSCLLMAYILYPVMKAIIESKNTKYLILLVSIAFFLMMYSNVLIPYYDLDSLYSNPIARAAEFFVGASFAEIITHSCGNDKKNSEPIIVIILFSVISLGIAIFNKESIKNVLGVYLVMPVILIVLTFSSRVRLYHLERSKPLNVLSGISYMFYLMQMFLWRITEFVLTLINIQTNEAKIISSFFICILLSWFISELYDKPVKRLLMEKLL